MEKVLFLGNSFTYYNGLPQLVENLSGGELVCHSITRGGAYLNAYKSETDNLTVKLRELLKQNKYDYVVLQEQSLNAIADLNDYISSVENIAGMVGDTKILIFETWSYADCTEILHRTGLTYNEMVCGLAYGAALAAKTVGGTVVPVGTAFAEELKNHPGVELYDPDGLHPSYEGSLLAAKIFISFMGDNYDKQ